jgi:hypothetical protein
VELDELKKLLFASAAVPLMLGVVGAATTVCLFGSVPHPQSGGLRGTFAPENEFLPIGGRASVRPYQIGLQEESWGAIKSLYR